MTSFDPQAFGPPLLVPRLSSASVHLRPFETADLALVRQASRDPEIPTISAVPPECSDEDALDFIERQHRLAAEGHGYSFVVALGDGDAIGSIGLWLRDIASGRATVGYWLLARARGRGLAAEALRTLAVFGFAELGIPRLHLFVEPDNVASGRTARAAGFRHEGTLRGWERIDGAQRDADCYALLREEWEAAPLSP